ncbi:MAG: hypothetical protein A3E79_19300 [Burkholderiales bacterium RIFCSPHIGHO2_12_FULL_61_11]|nr:MAG: hypothetical protein A3E79_19300 [Burkholderiales bacterium RIFCSPHIGHO2_12_FULL_61_11]
MNTDIRVTGRTGETGEEEYVMPCAEAMLAGTLALMTGHVQACCDGHRVLMAKKIVANLVLLSEHPLLSPQFKTMLWNLRERWREQLESAQDMQTAQADPDLWHASPSAVQ